MDPWLSDLVTLNFCGALVFLKNDLHLIFQRAFLGDVDFFNMGKSTHQKTVYGKQKDMANSFYRNKPGEALENFPAIVKVHFRVVFEVGFPNAPSWWWYFRYNMGTVNLRSE